MRPPVVLVHGAYDNAVGAWLSSSKLGESLPSKTLPSLLEKAGFVPFLVDYEATNGKSGQGERSSFWYNRFVVWNNGHTGWLKGHDAFIENSKEASGWLTDIGIEKARSGGINQALEYFRNELKIAATRADVVGHSMGGLLARVYASDSIPSLVNDKQSTGKPGALNKCNTRTPYNPEYRRPDNFGRGDINRLITIGTPHHGSELPEIFNLITLQEIEGAGLKSQLMRTAAYYASWLRASKTADTAATVDLTRESCALQRIGKTDVRSHAMAGVTSAAALDDPVYGNYLQDFELIASLFYYNRELLQELFKQLADDFAWDKKSTDEKLRDFEDLLASEYTEWIKLEKNASDGWISESANKTVSVPHIVVQHLINLIFRFDKNDSTVRVDSQLAGLAPDSPFVTLISEENTDKAVKQSVLHSFEPRYPLIQHKLVELLWSSPEKRFADSLPPAGQKLKPHPFPDNFGVDLKLTGSFAKKWSGMDFRHADAYLKIAIDKKVVILARPVNPDSTELIIRGAATKGMNVKGKSSNWGPQKGYIPVEQRYSKLWRTAGNDRDKEVEEFNKKTKALLKAEKSDYQDSKGNPIAIGRQLKHSWNGNAYSVWMDPKFKDAEQSIYLCRGEPANSDSVVRYEKGKDDAHSEEKTDIKRKSLERPCDCHEWFDWRTTETGFDIKNKPMTPRQPDRCEDLRPLQVLADNTHPDKAFLTADYDLLTTGFLCPQGKNTPLDACQATLKINKPEAVKDEKDPTCIAGSTEMVNAEYMKGYPPEPMPCLDPQTGLITVAQVELLKALNQAVQDTGYTGGKVSHHGPETQFFASPYVDYPITAFDPGIPGLPETARILSIPKGIKGFRDIHLKRFYEEKIRQGYWLYPNPAGSANWHWQERGTKDKWRGWFYDDAPNLRKTNKDVEQIPQPPCVQREVKRRKEEPQTAVIECKQEVVETAAHEGGDNNPDGGESLEQKIKHHLARLGYIRESATDKLPLGALKQVIELYGLDYGFPTNGKPSLELLESLTSAKPRW